MQQIYRCQLTVIAWYACHEAITVRWHLYVCCILRKEVQQSCPLYLIWYFQPPTFYLTALLQAETHHLVILIIWYLIYTYIFFYCKKYTKLKTETWHKMFKSPIGNKITNWWFWFGDWCFEDWRFLKSWELKVDITNWWYKDQLVSLNKGFEFLNLQSPILKTLIPYSKSQISCYITNWWFPLLVL